MVRCKNATYPFLYEEGPEHSDSFASLSSDDGEEEVPDHHMVPNGDRMVQKKVVLQAEKQARAGKRLREEVAREEREAAEDGDFIPDDEIDEVENGNQGKKSTARKRAVKKAETEMTDKELEEMFIKIGFANPLYLHKATIEQLGIQDDVEQLLEGCGLDTFASKIFPVYPEPAAEFLATMRIHHFPDNPAMLERYGGGIINFSFQGKPKSLEFNDINQVFGFAVGEPKLHNVSKEDQTFVWYMLTGEKVLPTQPKATTIRHPAISYARRVIAKTFHCRVDPGNVNVSDLELLAIAFKEMFGFQDNKRSIAGDTAKAGLAYVLCKQLDSIKGKVSGILKSGGKPKKLGCGGIITGLLKKANVDIDWEKAPQEAPEFMDIDWLRDRSVLTGQREPSKFYYKFNIKGTQTAVIALPNKELTTLDDVENIRFLPDERFHVDPATIGIIKIPGTVVRSEAPQQPPKKRAPGPPCICTTDGFREKLVAELTTQITREMRAEINAKINAGIKRGLAELKKTIEERTPRAQAGQVRRERAHERQPVETPPAPFGRVDRVTERTDRPNPAATTGPPGQRQVQLTHRRT